MMNYARTMSLSLMIAMVLLNSGCGPKVLKTEKVTGKVTLDAKPLAGATVGFNPKSEDGHIGYAVTDDNGMYVLQTTLGAGGAGTTKGDYSVTVTKTEMIKTGTGKDNEGNPIDIEQPRDALPRIYANSQQTPFQVTVQAGENTHNFDLKSKP